MLYLKENRQDLQTPRLALSKNRETKALVSNLKRQEANIIKQKKKEFVINSKNRIAEPESNNYHLHKYEVEADFKRVAFDETTGKLDEGKYNSLINKYTENQALVWEKNEYKADRLPTTQLTSQQANNEFIKKEHEQYVTTSLSNFLLTGQENDFVSTVQAQAAYLDLSKAETMNKLFNSNKKGLEQDNLWARLDDMSQSPNGAMALKTMFGKEYELIKGVMTAVRYGPNISREQAIEGINKWKADPDAIRIYDKKVNQTIAESGVDYGPLNNEFRTMVNIAIAAGTNPDTAVDVISESFDKRVTTIGGKPAYDVVGTAPKVSGNAEDYYNTSLDKHMQEFEKANMGNPVQVEVLNNGSAIVRDATWGFRIKGWLPLQDIAAEAEKYAVKAGPTTFQKTQAQVGAGIDVLVSKAEEGIETAKVLGKEALKGIQAQVDKTFDFLFSTEAYKKAQANQSKEGKAKMEEVGISLTE